MEHNQISLFEESCSQKNAGEPLKSSPQAMTADNRHLLFSSLSVYKLFEGFNLDIHKLIKEQADLLDQIRAYLLSGGQKGLEKRMYIITKEYEDLWISLLGMRSIIKNNYLENLAQLDYYFDVNRKQHLAALSKDCICR